MMRNGGAQNRPTDLSISKPMLADDGGFEEVLLEPLPDGSLGGGRDSSSSKECTSLTPVNEMRSLIHHQPLNMVVNRKPFKRQDSVWSNNIPRLTFHHNIIFLLEGQIKTAPLKRKCIHPELN